MGKTPKEKVNERRRPYNYLRNTQAQGHFSGNETRNYYYSSGSVQRPVSYHRLRPAAPNQFRRSPFRGELYRDRASNIPKLGKPHLRKHLANKKIASPLKRAARRKMQEEQKKEGTGEVTQQEEQQPQPKEEEHNLKNGPSETSNVNEEKEKMENGLAAETDGSEKTAEQDSENLDEAPKPKPVSKDKKAKKSETPPKPKGKSSPKSTKDKKLESTEVKKSEKTEIEVTEIEIETKDKKATKKAKKETESHHIVSDLIQPTVKVLRLNPQMLAANVNEMNDSSVVEIPLDDSEEKRDALPSTSSDWPTASRASPRRSTRLQEQKHVQDDSVIIVQKSEPDDSVLVLENESVSVTEVSQSSKTSVVSFADALSGMRGRRSLRPLPPLNLASRRFPPVMRSTPEPLELKTRSFSSVVHKSSKSVMTTTGDLAADDDAANNSCSTEESGTEADGTSSELSSSAADLNTSGKRKISNIQLMDEVEHEHKRFRSINEDQMNSTGFLSMISSPMNAFASRIKSGKSSTPVNLVKVSPLPEEDTSHLTEDVSDIIKEQTDQSLELFMEKKKENIVVESSHAEVPQKKWCSVM